jgi:putative DNA primase/helicase
MRTGEGGTMSAQLDRIEDRVATDGEIERLAALSPVEYDRAREAAATRLGCRVATLERVIADTRRAAPSNDVDSGTGVTLADPSPWLDPVDGQKLLNEIATTASRYLVLPAGAASAIALWIMHAHAHDCAGISPILGITSPSPECGKTTLLSVLGALVPRPLLASNITAAALFRAVEKWRPTLLIDEADTYLRDSDDLRGVLNSGHQRASAWVIRTVGDDHDPRRFRTWAPKAVALIGKLPATLDSRAIHIELRRMAPGEDVEQLRPDRIDLEPLRRRAWRWAADHAGALRDADPDIGTLRGRTADNWRPLYGIADLCGGEWPARARRAAEALSAGRSEQTAGIILLADICRIMAGRDRIPSADLAAALSEMEDRPWPEWGRSGRPITARQIARLLEPFKVRPRTVNFGAKSAKGYLREWLVDAFARYLPAVSVTTSQSSNDAGFRSITSVTDKTLVTDQDPRKAAPALESYGVTDREAEIGPDEWEASL